MAGAQAKPEGFAARRAAPRAARVLAAALLCGLLAAGGCTRHSTGVSHQQSTAEMSEQLLANALNMLMQLERYDDRQASSQVVDRLNQWTRAANVEHAWQPDPLLQTLPDHLAAGPWRTTLGDYQYDQQSDAPFLKEAVWLRDLSSSVGAGEFDDLQLATRLFDWIVRNIQLEDDSNAELRSTLAALRPDELLLLGRGTAEQRAWLFALAARQQGLDVVLLAIADPERAGTLRPWAAALVTDEGLYLFDPELGLPIPGPGGLGVATLRQAIDDPAILAHLDLDPRNRYRVQPADLQHLVVLVEGGPGYLTRRMRALESHLAGEQRVVLSADPSSLAERLEKLGITGQVRLWPLPYQALAARAAGGDRLAAQIRRELRALEVEWPPRPSRRQVAPLRAGRILQLRGQFDGERGAKHHYLTARPSNEELEQFRLRDPALDALPAAAQLEVVRAVERMKQNATYWLGLIMFEEGEHAAAIDFFGDRTQQATTASGAPNPWLPGARYNLARTYEAAGQRDKALELYRQDLLSPQFYGNRLRAKWVEQQSQPEREQPPAS